MVAAISSPGAVLQVSLYRGCCPSSVRRPSLAFHIFDISSRFISWIELKLSVCVCVCVWGGGGGDIVATRRFRIAKFVSFRYPKVLSGRPSRNSLNDISSQTVSRMEGDMEIQNC